MEKFPFLFFVPTAPEVQLWFRPLFACRLPSGFCSHPDRIGLKQQLIRGLLLIQAGVREGYSSYNWNARCA